MASSRTLFDQSVLLCWCILVIIYTSTVHSQSCEKFSSYTKQRFNKETRSKICNRNKVWSEEAISSSRGRSMDEILTPKQRDYFTKVNECDLICICKSIPVCNKILSNFDGNGGRQELESILANLGNGGRVGRRRRRKRQAQIFKQNLRPVVRKEYRVMTDDERNRFHNALNQLKRTTVDGQSRFDILILYHTPQYAPGAHFGAAFLPFHRELLKFLETALRLIDPNVAIPYWDSTLDEPLPDPSQSVMWSDEFMGNPRGVVTRGPFAGWNVFNHQKAREVDSQLRLVRNVGVSTFGSLYKPEDIQQIKRSTRSFRDFGFCVDPFFEMVHGAVHLYVGGMMDPLEASPNDPSFFLLHAFVDKLWEEFRQTQNPAARENDYTQDNEACNANHFRNANMRPFARRNIDGLSNEYTQNYYRYDERPTCANRCGNSAYLFCNNQLGRCVSKVQQGGNCRGLERFDSCSGGPCVNGICRAGQPPVAPQTRPPIQPQPTSRPLAAEPTVWFPVTVQTFQNRRTQWAQGAQLRSTVMETGDVYEGAISENNDYPYFAGSAFAQIPNPNLQGQPIKVRVEAFDRTGLPCAPMCYDQARGYVGCQIMLDLFLDPARSTPIVYTPYFEQAPYLSWNGPERKPDMYYFLCPESGSLPNINQLRQSGVFGFKQEPSGPDVPDTCVNRHRCCRLWQTAGECNRNPLYMNTACMASCGRCTPNAPLNSCVDRFSNCDTWARIGECNKNAIWMDENCARACGRCRRTLEEIQSLCGVANGQSCDNFNVNCQRWANSQECRKNEWWMTQNCPLACQACRI